MSGVAAALAAVRLDSGIWGDDRFDDLARRTGLVDGDHARAKMARLWAKCTARQTYALPIEEIERTLGADGAAAVVAAGLGELDDGGVRLRGTTERIEWYGQVRTAAAAGGRARAEAGDRGADGRYLPADPSRPAGERVDDLQPAGPAAPAASSPLTPSPSSAPPPPSLFPTPDHGSQSAAVAARRRVGRASKVVDPASTMRTAPSKELFLARYLATYGRAHTWGAKEGGMLKKLVNEHGNEPVMASINLMFDGKGPPFLKVYDLGTLVQHFNKLVPTSVNTSVGSAPPSADHGVGLIDPTTIGASR